MFNPRLNNDPMNEMYNPLLDKWEPVRKQARNGAHGFFFIAALSLVNSYFVLRGIPLRFIAGLGIAQIVDVFATELVLNIGTRGFIVGFLVNVLIAGIFVLFGVFARRLHTWSFLVGMVLYALDGVLLLFFRDFLGMGFHLVVLFFIYKGFSASRTLQRVQHTKEQPQASN
jgi:hypothetical protein